MKQRRTQDLANLSSVAFSKEVSEGLHRILSNANTFFSDAEILASVKGEVNESDGNGVNVLMQFAQEEAGKFLILMDAVRCRAKGKKHLVAHLKRMSNHLSKGIYNEVYRGRPADFREVIRYVEKLKQEYYLDGPEGHEWIFSNEILRCREQELYVDYVWAEDEHYWFYPSSASSFSNWFLPPASLNVARALSSAGLTSPGALELISDHWKNIVIAPEFRWHSLRDVNYRTLEIIDENNLLEDASEEVFSTIINDWLFPLDRLDTDKQIEVDMSELATLRERMLVSSYEY